MDPQHRIFPGNVLGGAGTRGHRDPPRFQARSACSLGSDINTYYSFAQHRGLVDPSSGTDALGEFSTTRIRAATSSDSSPPQHVFVRTSRRDLPGLVNLPPPIRQYRSAGEPGHGSKTWATLFVRATKILSQRRACPDPGRNGVGNGQVVVLNLPDADRRRRIRYLPIKGAAPNDGDSGRAASGPRASTPARPSRRPRPCPGRRARDDHLRGSLHGTTPLGDLDRGRRCWTKAKPEGNVAKSDLQHRNGRSPMCRSSRRRRRTSGLFDTLALRNKSSFLVSSPFCRAEP